MPSKTSSILLTVLGAIVLVLAGAVAGHFGWPLTAGWRSADSVPAPAVASEGRSAPKTPAKPLYHCPMHPNYVADKMGTCPICNMDLVLIEPGAPAATGAEPEGHASIVLNSERRQLIGLRTGTALKKRLAKTVRAVGRVEYNQKAQSAVSLKYSGWAQDVNVRAVGDPVRKGDALFSIYSPEALEAQRNYLIARETGLAMTEKSSAANRALGVDAARSARERLLLWDFTEDQVKQIETQGEPMKYVTVFSRTAGVVTARNIVPGKYIEAGTDLYELVDLSTVWINADVYEYEIPLIAVGQEARVELSSLPGDALNGKVAYIYPYLNEQTRTARVRIEFANADGKLKPGMYATVAISVDLGDRLVVDDGAVLFTGTRSIVFVDKGDGLLEPRNVTTGESVDGVTIVQSGLAEGDKVVTSGNFLVDSESRLKSALKQGAPSAASGQTPGPQ